MLPLSILEVAMIILAFWMRRRKAVGYAFVYTFAFVSGITLFPIVSHYASIAGAYVVLEAFGSTFVILPSWAQSAQNEEGFILPVVVSAGCGARTRSGRDFQHFQPVKLSGDDGVFRDRNHRLFPLHFV